MDACYYIIAFPTTADAIAAETYARDRIRAAIMPVPRELSAGCGLALRLQGDDAETNLRFCKDAPFTGTLYRMGRDKIGGRHPVEKLLEF